MFRLRVPSFRSLQNRPTDSLLSHSIPQSSPDLAAKLFQLKFARALSAGFVSWILFQKADCQQQESVVDDEPIEEYSGEIYDEGEHLVLPYSVPSWEPEPKS